MGWQNNVFNQLIVEGTDSGVFVYNGTRALGTLIASIASSSVTEDQYGNFVEGGAFAVYGLGAGAEPLAYLSATGGPGGNPALVMFTARPMEVVGSYLYNYVTAINTALETLALSLEGPEGPGGDRVQMFMFSGNEGNTSSAQGQLTYFKFDGTEFDELLWGKGGLFLNYVEDLIGQEPGQAFPTQETMHPVAAGSGGPGYLNSWVGFTGRGLNYKFYPDSSVAIAGRITAPAGLAGTSSQVFQLPAGYAPQNVPEQLPYTEISAAGAYSEGVYFEVNTSGIVTCFYSAAPAAGTGFSIDARFPTDRIASN